MAAGGEDGVVGGGPADGAVWGFCFGELGAGGRGGWFACGYRGQSEAVVGIGAGDEDLLWGGGNVKVDFLAE